jgi:hypothetical protein
MNSRPMPFSSMAFVATIPLKTILVIENFPSVGGTFG